MSRARVRIVENPRRHIRESTKRYHVMLDGAGFSEVYYDTNGYRGALPYPGEEPGAVGELDIGERGIAEYRREVASINQQFAREAAATR